MKQSEKNAFICVMYTVDEGEMSAVVRSVVNIFHICMICV